MDIISYFAVLHTLVLLNEFSLLSPNMLLAYSKRNLRLS